MFINVKHDERQQCTVCCICVRPHVLSINFVGSFMQSGYRWKLLLNSQKISNFQGCMM